MINLLPPDVKQQIAYSKRNAIVMRYITLTIIVATIAAAGIFYGAWYLQGQMSGIESEIKTNQDLVDKDAAIEKQAKAINDRLSSIQKIQDSQSKFSQLLSDIALVLPRGAAIESMSLDGDEKKPVRITGTAQSYEIAAVVASSLAKSPRVKESRTERIEQVKDKKIYNFALTVTFNPGKSK